MFSPRALALVSLAVAACTALPADRPPALPVPRPVTTITDPGNDDSWFGLPFFTEWFAPIFKFFPAFTDIGPMVFSDDDKFQISIRVQDYNKSDLKVKVKNSFIIVQGTHESKPADHNLFASQFFHTYSLPANSSADKVTAQLSNDGWLTVTAPVSDATPQRNAAERIVEITETGAPFSSPKNKEEPEKPAVSPASEPVPAISPAAEPVPAIPAAESTTASGDERREETTSASDREQVTEKDKELHASNSIPHGNEVLPL